MTRAASFVCALATLSFLLAGCAASMSARGLTGEKVPTVPVENTFPYPFDQIWSAAATVIIDSGYVPSFSEKSTGLLVAKRETNPGAVVAGMFGATNVIDHLTVRVIPIDSISTALSLRIKCSVVMNGREGAPSDMLDRGIYDQIFTAISQRLTKDESLRNRNPLPSGPK